MQHYEWAEDLPHLIGKINQAVVASGTSNDVLKFILYRGGRNTKVCISKTDLGMSQPLKRELVLRNLRKGCRFS